MRMETTLLAGRTGVRIPAAVQETSLLQNFRSIFGIHPASHRMGVERSLRQVKQLGSTVNHSTPSSAVVKNVWSYNSIPSYTFLELTGVTLPLISPHWKIKRKL
jgi:hypothetical protein